MSKPRVTERTFYQPLMDVIRSRGGQGVQEIQFNSEPDILFDLGGYSWFLSVKMGESPAIIKDAFLQYLRHKEESDIKRFGMLLLLPESMRQVKASENAVRSAIEHDGVTALIDAEKVKEEVRGKPFPTVIDFLIHEVLERLARQEATYYSLHLVISLLQQQVTEMMKQIDIKETTLLSIITDRHLLSDLGHLTKKHAEAVACFLGSYIFLSQILFLRLLTTSNPNLISVQTPATPRSLRRAFSQIRDINYKPIYKFDVLDAINQQYLRDTFDLLWGLEIERIRFELPGRIFHELMPHEIRKMLASFYTRPHAADLLAQLAISQSDETIFDPACGSGTILTSAYKRKLDVFREEGKTGNPHKRFCEKEIYGADIMPFAVHLTAANLSAMDAGTIIKRTQIIQGDSIRLRPTTYPVGITGHLFPEVAKAQTSKEDTYEVEIEPVDTVLMNPPFTKVERGIKHFVDMKTFEPECGGEVGLWGHFVMLADALLKAGGTYGAVIPINLLRGRENSKVRKFLFENWTPLYILKPTYNYGFSEWSEYRDILFIAKKEKPRMNRAVKFCLVKKDLTRLTDEDVADISRMLRNEKRVRTDDLVDIDTHDLLQIKERFNNMMWFCGITSLTSRDVLVTFIESFASKLSRLPQREDYCKTGFRPDGGYSKFLFLTRESNLERIERAFLRFSREDASTVTVQSPLAVSYEVSRDCLMPSLRTPVGIQTMDISDKYDYIAKKRYGALRRVCRAAGVSLPDSKFLGLLSDRLRSVETRLIVSRRINPFSPANHHVAFFSCEPLAPSDQMNVVMEPDNQKAQALCALLNSVLFFAQFFLLKEESTGRYIDIRVYDLKEMYIVPPPNLLKRLAGVFATYCKVEFPSLRQQFDANFDQRYEEFWAYHRGDCQGRLFSLLDKPVKPAKMRINLDLAVCKAVGLDIDRNHLLRLYEIFVNEMVIIKGLRRD
jgi:type I restriction-modification system DNA methylase subunit